MDIKIWLRVEDIKNISVNQKLNKTMENRMNKIWIYILKFRTLICKNVNKHEIISEFIWIENELESLSNIENTPDNNIQILHTTTSRSEISEKFLI
jgi:hypothetical protein